MPRQWIVWGIVAALSLAACSRQESGWRQAAATDSIAAYERYLQAFPAGAHAREAHARILDLQEQESWALAGRLRTPEGWQRYLGDWPDGRHAAAARRQLAQFVSDGPPPGRAAYAVQLGAYSSRAAAEAGLQRILRELQSQLDGVPVRLIAAPGPVPEIWRLRTGTLPEQAARELCDRLRTQAVDCVPVAE